MTTKQDQAALADKAFAEYDFGDGVEVTDSSGWEYTTPGTERSRKVYIETTREDDGPTPRWQLTFTVRFDKDGSLVEAYAIDNKGSIWGSLPTSRARDVLNNVLGQPAAVPFYVVEESKCATAASTRDRRASNGSVPHLPSQHAKQMWNFSSVATNC